ncbi:MAG: serine hydrolase domain-containing protein [Pseudomonadota bacterium]
MSQQDSFSDLSQWLKLLVERKALPCAVVSVVHKEETIFLDSMGWADVEAKVPIQEDNIFRLYSMSKPIVSIALMLLYEEGRFQLNEPVYYYLGPKWKKENMRVFKGWVGGESGRKALDFDTVPCESDITMAQLLTHTAGLSYGFDPSGRGIPIDRVYAKQFRHPLRKGATVDMNDTSMLHAFCDALPEMPLLYQPGTQWNYSYATDVCGHLVEVLSGQSLDVFLQERLFGPLGMVDAGFDVPPEKASRLAHNYRYVPPEQNDDGERIQGDAALLFPHLGTFRDVDAESRAGYLNQARPKFMSGGGGLVGTIHDYSTFCSMLLAGGKTPSGNRIIGRKTLEFITSNHLPNDQGLMDMVPNPEFQYSETAKNGGSFGLGFSIMESPQEAGLIGSVGNFAWGGAAATIFWCDPVEDLHVIFCTQVMGMQPPNALRAKLGSFVYGALA